MARGKKNKLRKAERVKAVAPSAPKTSTDDKTPNASQSASNASPNANGTPPARPRRPSASLSQVLQPSLPDNTMAGVAAEVAAAQIEKLRNLAKRNPSTTPFRRHKFKTKQPGAHVRTASVDAVSNLAFHQCDHESVLPHQMAKVGKLLTKLFASFFDHTVQSLYSLNCSKYHGTLLQKVFHQLAWRRTSAPLPEDDPSYDEWLGGLEDACTEDKIPEIAVRVSTEEVMDMLGDFAFSHDDDLNKHGGPCACSFAKCCPCLESLVESMTGSAMTACPDLNRTLDWPGDRLERLSEIPDLPSDVRDVLSRLGTSLRDIVNQYNPLEHTKVAEIRALLLTMNPLDLYYQVLTRDLCIEPTDAEKTLCDELKNGCVLPMLNEENDVNDELPDPEEQANADRLRGSHRTCGHPAPHRSCGHTTQEKYSIKDGQLCLLEAYHEIKQRLGSHTADLDRSNTSTRASAPRRRVRANTIIKDLTGVRYRKTAAMTLSAHAEELVAQGAIVEAADLFKHAKALDRNEPLYALNRAACLLMMHAFQSAIKECNDAIALDPYSERAHFRRGICRVAQQDDVAAASDFSTFFKLSARAGSVLTAIPALGQAEFRPEKAVDDLCEWATGLDQPSLDYNGEFQESAASYLPRSTSDPNVSKNTPLKHELKGRNACSPCSDRKPFAAHKASIQKILLRCMDEAGVAASAPPPPPPESTSEDLGHGLGLSGVGSVPAEPQSAAASPEFDAATSGSDSPAIPTIVMTPCTSEESGQRAGFSGIEDGSERYEDLHGESVRSNASELEIPEGEKRRRLLIEYLECSIVVLYFGLQVIHSHDPSEKSEKKEGSYKAIGRAIMARMRLMGEPLPEQLEIPSVEDPSRFVGCTLAREPDPPRANSQHSSASSKSGNTAAVLDKEADSDACANANAFASSSKALTIDSSRPIVSVNDKTKTGASSSSNATSHKTEQEASAGMTKPKKRLSAKAQGKQRQVDTAEKPTDTSTTASKIQNLANRLPSKSSPPRPAQTQSSASVSPPRSKTGTSTVSSTALVEVTGSVQKGTGPDQAGSLEVSDVKITFSEEMTDGVQKKMKKVKAAKKI